MSELSLTTLNIANPSPEPTGYAPWERMQREVDDRIKGQREYVWQTSWGVSTRMVGGLIMCHGDDAGLRVPPTGSLPACPHLYAPHENSGQAA